MLFDEYPLDKIWVNFVNSLATRMNFRRNWWPIMCWSIGTALWLLPLGPVGAEDDDGPQIRADPATIPLGGVTKLVWVAHGAEAFLSGIGKVPPSGSLQLSLTEPTNFTLVVDDKGKIRSQSAKVALEGVKGDPIGPNFDGFSGDVSGQNSSLGFVQFEIFVFNTLQDMSFMPVHGDFVPGRNYDWLYTELKDEPKLVRPTDTGVRRRQIAYAVKIDKPNDDAKPPRHFEVRCLIVYQLLGESKWHHEEKNSTLVGQQSATLGKILEAPSSRSE
jgi:hypothetical protein